MPQPVASDRHYMPGVDGLRAVSVLLVILYHLDARWAPGGLLGVGIFFVLSGYLITDLLQAEWERDRRLNLKAFWGRRARRLLPALIVMLSVVVGWVALTDPTLLVELRGDALAALAYVANWWFIYRHVSYFARWGPPTPVGHLWSLAVEEQFYLVWPLVLGLGLTHLRRRSLVAVVGVLAALSAAEMAWLYHPGMDPNRVYYGTDTRAFSLLIGAGAALLWPSRQLATMRTRRSVVLMDCIGFTGLAVVGLLVLGTSEASPVLYRGGMVLLAVAAAAAVLAAAHPATRIAQWLGRSLPRWLGVRSYGIYLWHYPLIVLTTPLASPPNPVRMTLQVGAAIVAAALSWRYVEEPIRRGRFQPSWTLFRQPAPRSSRGPSARAAGTGVVLTLSASLSLVAISSAQAPAGLDVPSVTAVVPAVPAHTRPACAAPACAGSSRARHGRSSGAPGKPVRKRMPAGAGVTAIGDSVLIDATPDLEKLLPGIVADGVVGRQMYQAPSVIQWLRRQNDMGRRVFVLELGTNGPFTPSLLRAVLRDAEPVDHILLVNTRVPRSWQIEVNATLRQVAASYPHTTLVNWFRASAGHPSWFYPDGVHLNPTGAAAYAALVAHAVRAVEEASPSARPNDTAAPPTASRYGPRVPGLRRVVAGMEGLGVFP
jgi:peptidoglycan/LPS O-acetylase OafA/YrhL